MSLRAALTAMLLLGAAACSNAGPESAEQSYRRGLQALEQGICFAPGVVFSAGGR